MSNWPLVFIIIYGLVGIGLALAIVPRAVFRTQVERFVVRVSCGIVWPMFCGYLIGRAASKQ